MTFEQLKIQREALQSARFNGVLTVKAGDKWATYKSDAELQSALGDLDREIAKLEGRPHARRIPCAARLSTCHALSTAVFRIIQNGSTKNHMFMAAAEQVGTKPIMAIHRPLRDKNNVAIIVVRHYW